MATGLGFLPARISRIVKPSRLDARERSMLKDPGLNQANTGDVLQYPAFSRQLSKPAGMLRGCPYLSQTHATQRSACATASSLAPTHAGAGNFLSSAVHWNARNGSLPFPSEIRES